MTKANYLLETSKDFFIKPSTIIEKESTPPPILPNFNTTNNLPQINRNSFEEKYQNNSIIWSDEEEDNEHNESFLPIGVPPIHHHSTISSSSHLEQQDDIDIVHIRPLNNLSAFNFDCQQMNSKIHFFYFFNNSNYYFRFFSF
jgi:hypothetical protein